MTQAVEAHGTLLKLGDGAGSESFATIAEVKTITGPALSLSVVDVTSQSSPGHFREKIGGILDAGNVSFDVNFVPSAATHNITAGLMYLLLNRIVRNYELVFPDAGTTTWKFACFVKGLTPTAPVEGVLAAKVDLEVTGTVTLV